MAENEAGEKSERPTGRRLGQARQDGQVGKSTELSLVASMIAAYMAVIHISPYLWTMLQALTKRCFTGAGLAAHAWTVKSLSAGFYTVLFGLFPPLLLIVFIAAFCGSLCTAFQTRFLFSWSLLKPKFHLLNPMAGLKRIGSIHNIMSLLRAIIKLIIISPIAYGAFWALFPKLVGLMNVPLTSLLPFTASATSGVFREIMTWLALLAIADLCWQKWHTFKSMKMTKNEVKDEQKSVEGDERTRRRILQIGLQRARSRMMQNVPKADVVVTNPTHIAVALCYSMEPGAAPKVVAKGKGYVAERIKKIARENGVVVLERKPLARALFASVEVGQEIPVDLYHAVADVLAYVFRVKGRTIRRPQSAANPTQRK